MKPITACLCILGTAATCAADYRSVCGWTDLVERLGEDNVPRGDGVIIAMVESGSDGNYALDECSPWACDPEFDGQLITLRSGASGKSSHAHSVGIRLCGHDSGMAPEILQVQCYEVNGFIGNDCLKTGNSSSQPEVSGAVRVWNHSWAGDAGSDSYNTEICRRIDWMVDSHATKPVVCVGLNNGSEQMPLLANCFNVIAVGCRNSDHSHGAVPAGQDGAGRQRPDLCGPEVTTSYSTSPVSAAAAMLIGEVRGDDDLPDDGEQPSVIKAILMASANHVGPGDDNDRIWSNGAPETGTNRGITAGPLDAIVGAGHLDVNRAHVILTAGMQTAGAAAAAGWSRETLAPGSEAEWSFNALGSTDMFVASAAWNREVSSTFNSWSLADLNLELLRVLEGEPQPLTGDAGIEVFTSGNVRSESQIDPVEHLYVTGLAAGHYVLRLERADASGSDVDVAVAWYTTGEVVDADLDENGVVGIEDLLSLLTSWSACTDCAADLNQDGVLDLTDLLLLIARWGA
ncbi:MAG: hypothetical protein GY894_03560 [Planctomycetes bacterium]|jgi:hypothetical protein|nr:hypothetical protein [Planctomycetota bacterium]MCP4838426.1 hypothetical protein [Planctomycetota bacterium]